MFPQGFLQQILQQYLGGPHAGNFGRNPYGSAPATSGGYSPIAGTGRSGPVGVSGQNAGPGPGYSPTVGTGRQGPFGQGGPRLPWQPRQAQEPQALWGVKQWAPATFPGQPGSSVGPVTGSAAEAAGRMQQYLGQAPAQQQPQEPAQAQEPWRPGMMPRPVEVPQSQEPVQDNALAATPRITRGSGRRF